MEVAIVVVIVAVLAVLGIVGYRRYVASAHMAEATNMSSEIRAGQERHKTETGIYASISQSLSGFYPATTPGKFVTEWGGPCTSCFAPRDWEKIAVKSSGPVMFGYATVAGVGGAPAPAPPPAANQPQAMALNNAEALASTTPFYATVAWGDTDGDGVPCVVMSYSYTNNLLVQGDGE